MTVPYTFIYSPLPTPNQWHTWVYLNRKKVKIYIGITGQIIKNNRVEWTNSLGRVNYTTQYGAAVALYSNWKKGKHETT